MSSKEQINDIQSDHAKDELVMTFEEMKDDFKVQHAIYVTVDVVAVSADLASRQLKIAIITRGAFDQTGREALPGGYMSPKETFLETGLRELKEETRIDGSSLLLREVGMADSPLRAKGKRVIGISYLAFGVDIVMPEEGIDSSDAVKPRWVSLNKLRLPGSQRGSIELAFEGPQVVDKAIIDLRQHFDRHPPIAYVNGRFKISDLARFYETIHQQLPLPIEPFQRAVLMSGLVTQVSDSNIDPSNDPLFEWTSTALNAEPAQVIWNVNVSDILGVPRETYYRYEFGLQTPPVAHALSRPDLAGILSF